MFVHSSIFCNTVHSISLPNIALMQSGIDVSLTLEFNVISVLLVNGNKFFLGSVNSAFSSSYRECCSECGIKYIGSLRTKTVGPGSKLAISYAVHYRLMRYIAETSQWCFLTEKRTANGKGKNVEVMCWTVCRIWGAVPWCLHYNSPSYLGKILYK